MKRKDITHNRVLWATSKRGEQPKMMFPVLTVTRDIFDRLGIVPKVRETCVGVSFDLKTRVCIFGKVDNARANLRITGAPNPKQKGKVFRINLRSIPFDDNLYRSQSIEPDWSFETLETGEEVVAFVVPLVSAIEDNPKAQQAIPFDLPVEELVRKVDALMARVDQIAKAVGAAP